jgi:hypothetical protein
MGERKMLVGDGSVEPVKSVPFTLTCQDCGATFTFGIGEQQFFSRMGYSTPKRCQRCREARQRERNRQGM